MSAAGLVRPLVTRGIDAHESAVDVSSGGHNAGGFAVRISAALPRISGLGVQRFSASAGLSAARRVGVRASDVSDLALSVRPSIPPLDRLDEGPDELDDRLSA